MYSFHRRELVPLAVTCCSLRGAKACTGSMSTGWASVAGEARNWGRRRGCGIWEGGRRIRPSACMRNSATRQVMSLSSPLGFLQSSNWQMVRESALRLRRGVFSISLWIITTSSVLKCRAQ